MKKLSVFVALCVMLSTFAGCVLTAAAAEDTVTVNIVSFTRGACDDLRSSELLEAKVEGYSGNAKELTYKWTNSLGTYLYVYNSHNMYGINNTDGEIEIYNDDVSSSENMSGRSYKDSFTGTGYVWAAVYGANLQSSDLLGTVTVEVYDAEGNLLATDSHTGTRVQTGTIWGFIPTYTYYGFVQADLEADLQNIAFGMFEGDVKHIKDLLGETGMVHVTCAECSVPSAEIVSGSEHISVVEDSDNYSIEGISKGSGEVQIEVEKSNCKFHQETSVTTNVQVYVYRKPTTTSTATAIMLSNLDDDCTYYINHTAGVRGYDEDGNEIVIFENLTPNTEYQVEVIGHTEGTDPVYAYVYETTQPAHIGTVEVILNGTYDISTGTASGTRVDISAVTDGCETLYLRYEDTEIYFPLEKQETGVYSAVLSDGNYTIYTAADSSARLGSQELTIAGASRTRELFFNSVTYKLNGGTGGPEKLTEYYLSESSVTVSSDIPVKEGYIFSHWTDEDGNIYYPGDTLTTVISTPYTLTANYIVSTDVYVHIKINHISADGQGHNNDNGRHDITFTVDGRSAGETDYTEIISKTIDWNGTDEYSGTDYDAQFISQNDTEYTLYTANEPVLTNVAKDREYTFTTAKHSYEVLSVTQEYDENGDLQIYAEVIFNPNSFDMTFSVELDEAAKAVSAEFKPVAANVKVTSFYDTPYDEDYGQSDDDETEDWYTITQQRYTYTRVQIGEDGTGTATYPVWIETTDSYSAYYYRIEVVSYELADGSIISAKDADGGQTTYISDGERYSAVINVTGGKDPVSGDSSTLTGVWYENGAQQGSVKAVISIQVFDVTLDANGGTLDGTTEKTVFKDQITVPDITQYTPVKDGGYVFAGWYYADANGKITDTAAAAGDELYSDVTIVAAWKEPLTVKGSVTVSAFYLMQDEDGNTVRKLIPEHDRAASVTVAVQKIDMNGYPETVSHISVPVTYSGDYAVGTYEFTGLSDIGEDYRIKALAANYETTYQNALSSSAEVTDYSAYDDTHYIAVFDTDTEAVVNTYLEFTPQNFDLQYTIDASAIGEGFRPDSVEVLVLCDDGTKGTNPQDWSVISQMIDGDEYVGQETVLNSGTGTDSYSVWAIKPDGTTPYDYAIKVDGYSIGGAEKDYVEAQEPFRITYNGSARYGEINGQTQTLTALLVPRMYAITFDLNLGTSVEDAVTGMDAYLTVDGAFADSYYWSRGKTVSATPVRSGYKFLGWTDAEGNTVSEIAASSYGNVTLYASWSSAEAEFETLSDAGYYSQKSKSSDKVGVISFNARITNYEQIKESITEYGFYLYDAKNNETKVTVGDTAQLEKDNGEFHAIIPNIEPKNFSTSIGALPYVIAEGKEFIGEIFSASVSAVNKWLGPNNPYAN